MNNPTVYQNEDGDFWVRLDQVASEAEALAAVQAAWPDVTLVAHGIETVPLSESEGYWDRHRPGRKRRAWHFQDAVVA